MFESEFLIQGFLILFNNFQVLLFVIFGVMLGIVIGVLFGLIVIMGVVILLFFIYGMEFVFGLLMICGVFFGGVYGGFIIVILFKIFGMFVVVVIVIDGYELMKQGKVGLVLSVVMFFFFSGGMFSIIVLMFFFLVFVSWVLKFSVLEFFVLVIFGLSIIVSIFGELLIKGLIVGVGGLLIVMIGFDLMGGFLWFIGGFVELMNVLFILVMIGLFVVLEVFCFME